MLRWRAVALLGLFATAAEAAETLPAIDIYGAKVCIACIDWADHLREHGFTTADDGTEDILAVKRRLMVPKEELYDAVLVAPDGETSTRARHWRRPAVPARCLTDSGAFPCAHSARADAGARRKWQESPFFGILAAPARDLPRRIITPTHIKDNPSC